MGPLARGQARDTEKLWPPCTPVMIELWSCIAAKSTQVRTIPEKLQIQPLAHLVQITSWLCRRVLL